MYIFFDTLESQSPALTREEQQKLYEGVSEDYAAIKTKENAFKPYGKICT